MPQRERTHPRPTQPHVPGATRRCSPALGRGLDSEIRCQRWRHDPVTPMAPSKPFSRLGADDSAPRRARQHRGCRIAQPRTANITRRDRGLVRSRLVSDSIAPRSEFFHGKSGGKSALDRLYRSMPVGFTRAAFKPRGGLACAALGRLGESYVAARRSQGERFSEAARCIQLGHASP